MSISYEQIYATADSLLSQGIRPTQTAVRDALGGGSFTTISEGLRLWRQEQVVEEQLQQVVIPPDIIERSQLLTAQVWEVAQSIANDRLMKEREALAHAKALAQQDVDEANQVVCTLEKEQTELLTQLDSLTGQLEQQRGECQSLQQQNREQLDENTLLQQQRDTEQQRVRELQNQLEQLQGKYDSLLDKHSGQTTLLATTQNDLEHSQQDNRRLQEAISDLQQRHDKVVTEYQDKQQMLTSELTELKQAHSSQGQHYSQLQAVHEHLVQANADLLSQLEAVKQQQQTSQAQALEKQQQLQEQLSQAKQEKAHVQGKLDATAERLDKLLLEQKNNAKLGKLEN